MNRSAFTPLAALAGLLAFPSLSLAQIVVSDDFTATDGTALAGRVPPVGQAWTQPTGTAMTITNGIINTTGGDRSAFVPFTERFDGSKRLFKLTVDITTLTSQAGYAGLSLFDGTQERAFFGHLSGSTPSIGIQVNRGPKLYANPATPTGRVTLLYDWQTGRTAVYAGDTITGPTLISTMATPGLNFDRIRIQNGSGANIAISSLSGEMLAQGPVTIDQFEPDAVITLQASPPLLYWGTSFADKVTITPGFGTVDPTGFVPIHVTAGDYTYQLTATDSASGNSLKASTTIRSVIGGEATFRYLRYTTIKTRVAASASTQLSEFLFYHGADQIVPVGVENPGGTTNPNGSEDAAKVIDGKVNTKWLDQNRQPLIFDLGENPPAFDSYSMGTPNDAPERDPVQWILEGSNDKTTWSLVDNVTAFDYPTSPTRQIFGQLNPLPGPSLIPYFGTGLVGSASRLVAGDALTLTYNVGYAQSASLSDGTTVTPLSGSAGRVEFHPTHDTTYTLTAMGKGGYTETATFQTAIVTPAINGIAYANFDNAGDELALIRTASIVNDFALRPLPGDQMRLRLTNEDQTLSNSVWFRKRQKLVAGFETSFGLHITRTDGGNGADGAAFVIQNAAQGSDLSVNNPETGAQTQALTIGFDTFANSGQPSAAQVRVASSGQTLALVDLATLAGFPLRSPGRLLDPTGQAAPYAVHVTYLPGSLSISMDGILIVDHLAVDLAALGALDSAGTAYVGFAARTGNTTEAHDITSWTLNTGAVVPPAVELKLLASSINPASGQVSLTWQSSAAKTYRITASPDLSTWSSLRSGVAGLAGQTTATVTSAPAARMFFCVEEE